MAENKGIVNQVGYFLRFNEVFREVRKLVTDGLLGEVIHYKTSSLPLAIVCLSAKLFGAKIVWIDSIANVERLSMSGRFVRHFADLLLTQWPELAMKYRNVEYAGALV